MQKSVLLFLAFMWRFVKSWFIPTVVLGAFVLCILLPVFVTQQESAEHGRQGQQLLARDVLAVHPSKTSAVFTFAPKAKRGFRLSTSARKEDEFGWNLKHNQVVILPLRQNSTFDFGYRHSGYRFKVEAIETLGVRVQVIGSSRWLLPERTELLPWSP